MPTYVYKCPVCGRGQEIIKPVAQIDNVENCRHDGFAMNRQICAPAVRGDYEAYECPVTGKWIEGKRQHEENLKRTGCRILEPGETESVRRNQDIQESRLLESVESTIEAEIHSMPVEKRDRLAAELQHGFDVSVDRSTPSA